MIRFPRPMRKSAPYLEGDEMSAATIKTWLAHRAKEDERLYEQYGKPLEQQHTGEFVAIGPEGQTILGTDPDRVLRQAIDTFGSGNFAITRVGEKTFGQWLSHSL
jgi:hypothetical protein